MSLGSILFSYDALADFIYLLRYFINVFGKGQMGNHNAKKNKSTTAECSLPKPPEGMPNPMDFDLEDIEAPDDVYIQPQNRQYTAFIGRSYI